VLENFLQMSQTINGVELVKRPITISLLIYFLAALLLLGGVDCKHHSVDPNAEPDTTSHNFSWQVWTFGGEAGGSYLNDVAIINENNIWAVGAIYLKDSTGQFDPNAYNAVHWDGSNWELKRIPFVGPCSAVLYPPLKAIWAFSANNILVTNGGSIVTYDGMNATMDCRMNPLLTGAINKIFAANTNDVYAVGNSGAIVHYNGQRWQKFESGTRLSIYDIYGARSSERSKYEILAVASELSSTVDRRILKIEGLTVSTLSDAPIAWPLSGVWFVPDRHYYVVGSGIYEKKRLSDSKWKNNPRDITTYYTDSVRGNHQNDVFVVGAFGEVLHYNGVSWQSYRSETALRNGAFGSVEVKGNLVVATGLDGAQAVILVGKRQE
jgi:hypothetical protein